MKIIYSVCQIITTTVCIPSDDYYSRRGDWQEGQLITLRPIEEFAEEKDAIEYMSAVCLCTPSKLKEKYTILRIYE